MKIYPSFRYWKLSFRYW